MIAVDGEDYSHRRRHRFHHRRDAPVFVLLLLLYMNFPSYERVSEVLLNFELHNRIVHCLTNHQSVPTSQLCEVCKLQHSAQEGARDFLAMLCAKNLSNFLPPSSTRVNSMSRPTA